MTANEKNACVTLREGLPKRTPPPAPVATRPPGGLSERAQASVSALDSNYATLLRIVQVHRRRWWWHRLTADDLDGLCVSCGFAVLAEAAGSAPSPTEGDR